MIALKGAGPNKLKSILTSKRVFVFGAGKTLEPCLDLYFSNVPIQAISDNNKSLWGKSVRNGSDNIPIVSPNELVQQIKRVGLKNCILFITSTFYASEIVEQFDNISDLDGLETYLAVLVRCTKEECSPFSFTTGKEKIPKKIHYIWIGGKPLPDEFQKNIDTWKRFNPDYEIIRWDESNYDFSKCDYVREAYKTRSWGFVPNYARLDIVYNEGGIYLDTDVEVVKNFDVLLNDRAFFCMGCADRVSNGCGFGSVAGHPLLKALKAAFEQSHFLVNGAPGKKPCHSFLHPVLRDYGFTIKNEYQKINDTVLYPAECMSPYTLEGLGNFYSERTLSIHKEAGTWKNEREKQGISKLKDLLKRLS